MAIAAIVIGLIVGAFLERNRSIDKINELELDSRVLSDELKRLKTANAQTIEELSLCSVSHERLKMEHENLLSIISEPGWLKETMIDFARSAKYLNQRLDLIEDTVSNMVEGNDDGK